ncbi:MAG: hypothetical protein ACU0CI_11615 [Shimia sp.]
MQAAFAAIPTFRSRASSLHRFTEYTARLDEGMYVAFSAPLAAHPRQRLSWITRAAVAGEIRIVDLHRCDGDKPAENWIFTNMPHFVAARGIDAIGNAAG